jgi:sorbitol-specific phosphotransferase system component IIBC
MVDRSRHLQMLHPGTEGSEHDVVVVEMRIIDQRIAHVGRALLCLVISGLAIGTTVAVLFLSERVATDLRVVTALTFVAAIALLMAALVMLLLETRLAARALRLPPELLEFERGDL